MTRIAVVIASLGRPDVLARMLDLLPRQTRRPDIVCVSVTCEEDAPIAANDHLEVIIGPVGSCVQRNRALDRVTHRSDVVVFFDDDFVPAPGFLGEVDRLFSGLSDIVGATGKVVADGVIGRGLSHDEARDVLARHKFSDAVEPVPSLYGCNMAFRSDAIGEARFDERLPLYGWLEDKDFSVRVGACGRLVRAHAMCGVHLGVKGGRTSGVRFGYSQVSNAAYLARKGTMPAAEAALNIVRSLAVNHVRALRPEPWVDRPGRALGNRMALFDLTRGRITPERILSL